MSMIDLDKWKGMARRDDWHRTFVGSDIRWMLAEIERLTAQIARDEEHYQAAMAMSEKHRKLWVEASQKNAELKKATHD